MNNSAREWDRCKMSYLRVLLLILHWCDITNQVSKESMKCEIFNLIAKEGDRFIGTVEISYSLFHEWFLVNFELVRIPIKRKP